MTLQARAAPAPEAEALAGYRQWAHGWTACGAAGSVAPSRPACHQPSLFQLPASPREQKSSLSLEDKFISLVFPWSLLGFTRRISVAWRRRAVYSMVSSEASGVSAGWTQMSPCPARRGCWGGGRRGSARACQRRRVGLPHRGPWCLPNTSPVAEATTPLGVPSRQHRAPWPASVIPPRVPGRLLVRHLGYLT